MKRARRVALAVALAWALFTAGVTSVAVLFSLGYQKKASEVAQRQAERLARGAEADLNRHLLGLDLALAGLPLLPGFLSREQDIDTLNAPRVLEALVGQSLSARDIVVLDGLGIVRAAATPTAASLGLALPTGFLAEVLNQRAPQLVFSAPGASLGSGEKVVYFARPLDLPGGDRVAAVAEVPVSALGTLLAPGVELPGLTLTLEDERGVLLASVPSNDVLLGRRHPRPLRPQAPDAADGLAPGRTSDAPGHLAARATVYRSLLVSAAITEAAVAAETRPARVAAAWVAAGFVALASVGAWAVVLHFARLARATRETERAKTVLEEALASMDEGFLLCDADDRIVSWNARYLELFPHLRGIVAAGVPFESLVRPAVDAVLPQGTPAERQAWMDERLARHRAASSYYEQRLASGRVLVNAERRTAAGGVVSVYRDLTQARADADALRRATAEAEASNEAKSRFLATMSHEIRTPLNGVLGMNGLLMDTPLDDEQRGYVEMMRQSGEALLDLINDVLDMSKLEAGRMELEQVDFEPGVLVSDVVSLLAAHAADKGVALVVEPPDGPPPRLQGDAGRLRQVLFNLVGNAVKFTEHGSVTVRMRTPPRDDGRVDWVFAVHDTGIGIPAEALPTLFEHFTQADSSTARRFGGSGLGLAISRQIVALMSGRIEVDSVVGQGSVFRVTVPLPLAPPAGADAAAPAAGAAADERPRPALRVLAAEDNRVNQRLVKALLERMGHFVDVVGDGREALRQLRAAQYDLVLMDIQMPVLDGEAAARQIRELPGALGRIPIVAMSAHWQPGQAETWRDAGMNACLAKPIDGDKLAAAIAEAMAGLPA